MANELKGNWLNTLASPAQRTDPAVAGKELRSFVLRVLSQAEALAQDSELPEAPSEFVKALDQLKSDVYNVLVLGEVKRGKSSLVNALLGLELLPTDVGVATCQVFKIVHSERNEFKVRFEDDSSRLIQPKELSKYGAETPDQKFDQVQLDKIIRWIEVATPFKNLPQGVSLLDTPGVGGLNKSHAAITQRFLRHADAAMFVLDSERPISHSEIDFLKSVVKRTKNVLFVQTKVDQRRTEEWQEILKRNEEIIGRHVGKQLPDTRVWPISSNLLMLAASASGKNSGVLKAESRYPDFEQALSSFLYRVVGWSRSVDATILGDSYSNTCLQRLVKRLESLKDESNRVGQEYCRVLEKLERSLQENSQESMEQVAAMEDALGEQSVRARRSMDDELTAISRAVQNEVDRVDSYDEAEGVAAALLDFAVSQASEMWTSIEDEANECYLNLLADYLVKIEADQRVGSATQHVPSETFVVGEKPPAGFLNRVFQARNFIGTAAMAAGVPSQILVATGILAPPLAALFVGGAAIWGAVSGWKAAARREAVAAQQQLHKHALRIMQDIRSHYERAREDLYRHLRKNLKKTVKDYAEKVREDCVSERSSLIERMKLDKQSRDATIAATQSSIEEWTSLRSQIGQLKSRLKADQEKFKQDQ